MESKKIRGKTIKVDVGTIKNKKNKLLLLLLLLNHFVKNTLF